MPRAGHKQAKKPPGAVLQRDPPAAAKQGKIPDPAPAGLCRAAFAGGRSAFSEHIPHGPRVSARGERRKSRSLRRPCRSCVCQSRQKQKSPGRGADPRPGALRLLGAKRRRQRPPALRHHRRAPGHSRKKSSRRRPAWHCVRCFLYGRTFLGRLWQSPGLRRPPPPGRKTRRPVFQPLCHACRMVSSAGAWQKE